MQTEKTEYEIKKRGKILEDCFTRRSVRPNSNIESAEIR
jgi:hypothetical protein